MTIEELIKEVNRRGYAINNLFQVLPEYWQCNIRKDFPDGRMGTFWGFAYGKSATEALEKALVQTEGKPSSEDEFAAFV